jgi:hypothetical protein
LIGREIFPKINYASHPVTNIKKSLMCFMRQILVLTLLILCAGAILAAGCTTAPAQTPKAQGDVLFSQGENEFNSSNFQTAANLFALAKENYSAAGDHAAYIRARDMAFLSSGAGNTFPYNRSEIEAEMAQAFPNASAAQRDAWLDAPMTATLYSEGQVWYFSETIFNIKNHNPSLLREENARAHYTSGYDELMPLITAPWKNVTGTYGAPVAYTGSTELDIPRGELPANGTLKVWMPVPVEYGSQTNVTILSVSPAKYVKSSTGTGADIGLVYLEIPLEEITDPFLNVTARYSFVQHEQRFAIDPAKVLPYNTSSPESQYVLDTGIGDCASQSLYFAALCRSLGIPARATGGYQMIAGPAGTHIWAEFYLEGYGWIPADVTVAEGGDTSYNATPDDLQRYRSYFFGSLDPYRFIIQKSLDLPVVPDPRDAVVPPFGWVQNPKIVCDTCPDNPMILSFTYSKITVTKE